MLLILCGEAQVCVLLYGDIWQSYVNLSNPKVDLSNCDPKVPYILPMLNYIDSKET